MPKKKFIDKKHSTTFVLGHRSQRDPLLADETAPQNILIPLDQVPDISKGGISASQVAGASGRENQLDKEKRREELQKYGIYFDDDYDYLQHLKDSNEVSTIKWDLVERIYAPNYNRGEPEKPEIETVSSTTIADLHDVKIKLPSSVFQSDYQEDVGLLHKAAAPAGPRPDLDPDVIAALDEDFDHEDPENELEDNFVQLANDGTLDKVVEREPTAEELEGLFSDDEENEAKDDSEEDGDSNYEDEEADSLGSLDGPQYSFQDEETKSHFTNYSMSSSVVRRNKQLLLVDDRFEKFFEGYEDTEIGALDCDEIEGDINPESDLLLKYAEEFEREKQQEQELNTKIVSLAVKDDEEMSTDEEEESNEGDERMKEKWDCQSIISTYSTTKNRPKIIKEPSKKNLIRISGKTGMPVGVLGKGGLTKENLKCLDNETGNSTQISNRSIMSGATSIRNKNESPAERRERKQLVKEYRKERRLEKKANSTAFKEEKKRIEKVRLNTKANVQGLKL